MMKKTPDTPAAKPQAPVAEKNEVLAALMVKLETGQLSADEQQKLSELMPQAKNSLNVLQMAMKREQYSGPIPHPDQLNKFDPETRKAIVSMAQKEQAHTHEMQRKGLDGAIKKDRRGQWLGFTIAVSGLAAAAYVAQTSPAKKHTQHTVGAVCNRPLCMRAQQCLRAITNRPYSLMLSEPLKNLADPNLITIVANHLNNLYEGAYP